jgi:hypothetical protein
MKNTRAATPRRSHERPQPPETPEGAAWELFMEIRRLEEKDAQGRGSNEPLRARLLDLYAECLAVTICRRGTGAGAALH